MNDSVFGSAFSSLILFAAFIFIVLWFLLPLMVYQIKHLIKEQIKETQEVRYAIVRLINALEKAKDK